MIRIEANGLTKIPLGRQGENLARQIAFDVSAWADEFGQGQTELIFQRNRTDTPYPVALDQDGTFMLWIVTAADTQFAGDNGRCELRYYVGDTLAKSQVWTTAVTPAIDTPESEEPPEAQQGWVDHVVAAGAEAKQAADRAESAAIHQPIIKGGVWWTWDAESGQYKNTGTPASGGGSGGGGISPIVEFERNEAEKLTTMIVTDAEGVKTAEIHDGKDGEPGPAGSDADVTAENIKAALGYTPANEETVEQIQKDKLDKPSKAPEVGKILKVTAVNEDGTFTCEWGDAPSGGGASEKWSSMELLASGTLASGTEAGDYSTGVTYEILKQYKRFVVQRFYGGTATGNWTDGFGTGIGSGIRNNKKFVAYLYEKIEGSLYKVTVGQTNTPPYAWLTKTLSENTKTIWQNASEVNLEKWMPIIMDISAGNNLSNTKEFRLHPWFTIDADCVWQVWGLTKEA